LQGSRILVVEDEYMLADDLCFALTEAGAQCSARWRASRRRSNIAREAQIDAAVLDVNLARRHGLSGGGCLARARRPVRLHHRL
jgi:DNA-binding response OmpR family regulator